MSIAVETASIALSGEAALTASRKITASGPAGFTSTGSSLGPLLTNRAIYADSALYRSFQNIAYRKNSDVQFIGANTTTNNSAVVPSHQENDLLIVFAVNGTSTANPVAPSDAGWTDCHYGGVMGSRVAYKFAKTNSEIAGIWLGSTPYHCRRL